MRPLALAAVLAALVLTPTAAAWTWPADGPVLQPFLFDPTHPYAGGQHRGIDVGGDSGADVRAPATAVATFGVSGDPELATPYVHLGVRVAAEQQGYLDPLSFLPPHVAPTQSPPPAPAAPPVAVAPSAPAVAAPAAAAAAPAATPA